MGGGGKGARVQHLRPRDHSAQATSSADRADISTSGEPSPSASSASTSSFQHHGSPSHGSPSGSHSPLQPLSMSTRSRMRNRAVSSHKRSSFRGFRPLTCKSVGPVCVLAFLITCTLFLTVPVVHKSVFKLSFRGWKEEDSPRIGRTVLSTVSGQASANVVSETENEEANREGRGLYTGQGQGVRLSSISEYLGRKGQEDDEGRVRRDEMEAEERAIGARYRHANLSSLPERRPPNIQPPVTSPLPQVDWQEEQPRVALCLIGGARDFQLTGPTLSKHLLRAYPRSDAFVLSPLDDNSHKLSLLISMVPNLVYVKIAPDVPVNESSLTQRLLAAIKGGPETPEAQTRQGILQQFKSVEMCASVISQFERRHDFKYEWVLRTRIDGFWMGPPPPLSVLDPNGYTIPGGSDWGGLNDRLGIGKRNISMFALRRLSAMNALVLRGGFEDLNAERVYRAHMAFLGIDVVRHDFPFCILSRKKGMPAFPVAAALSSTAALNGAKCRPCEPSLVGAEAAKYVGALPELVFSAHPHGIDLCLAESNWESNWEQIFDKDAGPQGAAVREYMEQRTFQECVRDWDQLRPLVPTFDAPPSEPLCIRERLGKFRKLGYPGGEFPVFIDPFLPPRVSSRTRMPVIYSVVVGVDYSFDWALLRKLKGIKARLHAFDSTPRGLRWVSNKFDSLPPESWIFHPWLIGPTDAPLEVYQVELDEHPVEFATRLPDGVEERGAPPPIKVEAHSLEYTMKELNHSWIDILRIGGHPSLHEDIFASWFKQGSAPPICQIVVSFHRGEKHYGSQDTRTRKELLELRALGYELAACLRKDELYESCVFFSVDACDYDL